MAAAGERDNGRILVHEEPCKARHFGMDESPAIGEYCYLRLLLKTITRQAAAGAK